MAEHKTKTKKKKQPYQKAMLKSFSLAAEEVLAGGGCKGVAIPGATSGAPCAASGCSAVDGS